MNIKKIIYYTVVDGEKKTISLRDLCLKDESCGLETIFQVVNESTDVQDFLEKINQICCERIEFDHETPGYIRFIVTDVYDSINFLKLRKQRITPMEAKNEND